MMNKLDTHSLTETQAAHLRTFDERTKPRKVDFGYYDRARFGPWNPYWYVYDFVKSHRTPGTGQRLLCVGCGNGRDALLYAHAGYDVFGIDISGQAVEIANELAQKYELQDRVQFSQQPAESLGFADNYFDLAVGVNVLHHVDIARTAAELKRVMAPGGYGVFKEPLRTPIRDKFRNMALIRWLVPKGIKSLADGVWYKELVPGEKNLDRQDFATIRNTFGNLHVHRWHVISKASRIVGRLERLERWDWRLFSFLPVMRRFGDQAVLVFQKEKFVDPRTAAATGNQ